MKSSTISTGVPSSVLGAALFAPTTVTITERGRDACSDACPPGADALECAAEWEEVVPCRCACHGAPLPVRAADVLALAGLPTARSQAPWVQIVTERGVLMVPMATVERIEAERAAGGAA